jgi:hypothetical protein
MYVDRCLQRIWGLLRPSASLFFYVRNDIPLKLGAVFSPVGPLSHTVPEITKADHVLFNSNCVVA